MHRALNDAELLRRIAVDHDRGAFAELFRQFAPQIAGYYDRQRVDMGVRDELVQEVMLRVWRNAHRYDVERAAVSTWVFTIARNARIDHLRRGRVHVDELDPTFVDDEAPQADMIVSDRQRAGHLRSALDDLPADQLAVLQMAYFESKTLREIAEESGVALGTIKSRVRLAFGRLRKTLGAAT